ncbi:hypothetical protein [Paracoccus methylarcula]|nr:hypothetical protein [Paracoccus methylarcula]
MRYLETVCERITVKDPDRQAAGIEIGPAPLMNRLSPLGIAELVHMA